MRTKRQMKFDGFSLIEVVLALGVVAFAIVAIIGAFPVGMQTGHAAQDETRAPQIAQDIFAALAAQARTTASPVALNVAAMISQFPTTVSHPSATPTPFSTPISLQATTTGNVCADNDGNLKLGNNSSTPCAGQPYQVTITTAVDPTGFNSGYACQVTVRVAWQPFAQNYREFVRTITRY